MLAAKGTPIVCSCGKTCKNHRGMKIHQTRSGCQLREKQKQRTGLPGETREKTSQVSNHSASSLSAPVFSMTGGGSATVVSQAVYETPNSKNVAASELPNIEDSPIFGNHGNEESPIFKSRKRPKDVEPCRDEILVFPEEWCAAPLSQEDTTHNLAKERKQPTSSERKQKVTWPKSNDVKWKQFDEDLDQILQTTLIGPATRKLQALPSLAYALGKERFGLEKPPGTAKSVTIPNRRSCEIKKLRLELRCLRKRYRLSTVITRKGIVELREQLRTRLKTLTTAERLRRKRREKAKSRADFISHPYKFAKTLLTDQKTGKLESSQKDVEEYLTNTHSDQQREEPLGNCNRICPEKEPDFPLDMKEPSWKEVCEVVRKTRACSAPGPSGIPYKVYKKCPKLLRRLWSLLRVVWRKGTIPTCWQQAEGCLTPKEENSKTIEQFRTISLLSVEGKIFFAILARRLTSYMTQNAYINTSVQKGGVPGLSGCVEHTSALTQLLHEARINNKDLTVVWLDLANAYGSIPHQLIKEALQHYHIPTNAENLITSYLNNINLRFSCEGFTTKWIPLEKGIVTGCTISVILFIMGMNMIIKTAERESRGPKTNSGIHLPSNRGFMDDMTITTETHIQTRWILKALDETVTWARMRFKPAKSRCLVVRNGKVTNKYRLYIQNEEIPALTNNPVKCLGKWFDTSLSDKNSQAMLTQQADEGLRRIDKSGLTGKFKAWIYQHSLLPRLTWPLMVNDIPISLVEKLEQKVSKHLRIWLGLPPSFTSIGLYGKTNRLQVPLSSLVEEYKVAKTRLLLTLRDSTDEMIRNAGIEVRTGRKWSVTQTVDSAEASLKHQDIVGNTNKGREGLGTRLQQRWDQANKSERRALVQSEVRREEEKSRSAKAVQLGPQGHWTRWNVPERKLTWQELWTYEPLRLSFLLRSVYDLLPSPTNLHRWKLIENPNCQLCEKTGTLRHVLSGCPTSLSQGRYRWRHDQVLKDMAHILELERKKNRPPVMKGRQMIKFVKAGETKPTTKNATGILQESRNWEMRADLKKRLQFPEEVAHTTLRPDIVLWSKSPKLVILIELTVPWEERIDEAFEFKRSKYEELVQTCRENGWKTWIFPVEIGCRGFPSQSVWKMLGSLGIKGKARTTAAHQLGKAAERTSCWLWLQRGTTTWQSA